MDVTAKCEGKELEFQLQGELDHHGAKGLLTCLEREIERTLPMVLVLDFSGVTFMDSSGIAVALRGWQRPQSRTDSSKTLPGRSFIFRTMRPSSLG